VERAITWEQQVEENLLKHLTEATSHLDELEQRVKKYEIQAQDLVLNSISSG
jgi:hypothetical protein